MPKRYGKDHDNPKPLMDEAHTTMRQGVIAYRAMASLSPEEMAALIAVPLDDALTAASWLNLDDEYGVLRQTCDQWWSEFKAEIGAEQALVAAYRLIEKGRDPEIGKSRLVRALSSRFWTEAGAILKVDAVNLSRGEVLPIAASPPGTEMFTTQKEARDFAALQGHYRESAPCP
jgi:hypothetical protein